MAAGLRPEPGRVLRGSAAQLVTALHFALVPHGFQRWAERLRARARGACSAAHKRRGRAERAPSRQPSLVSDAASCAPESCPIGFAGPHSVLLAAALSLPGLLELRADCSGTSPPARYRPARSRFAECPEDISAVSSLTLRVSGDPRGRRFLTSARRDALPSSSAQLRLPNDHRMIFWIWRFSMNCFQSAALPAALAIALLSGCSSSQSSKSGTYVKLEVHACGYAAVQLGLRATALLRS